MNSKESLSLSMYVLWVNPIQVELVIKLYLQPCHIKTTINCIITGLWHTGSKGTLTGLVKGCSCGGYSGASLFNNDNVRLTQ